MTVRQAEKDTIIGEPETMANTTPQKVGDVVLELSALSPQYTMSFMSKGGGGVAIGQATGSPATKPTSSSVFP